MLNKREKIIQITIASITTLILSYGLFLATTADAKTDIPPGEKIKAIVHEYKEQRKELKTQNNELKEEIRKQKEEIIAEVKSDKTQAAEQATASNDEIPATSIPTQSIPQTTPVITIKPTDVPPQPTEKPQANGCTESGGVWRTFPNSCVDSCTLVTTPDLMCLQALTEGCDCGIGSCWNGESCVNNPSVLGEKKTLPTPTIEVPPPVGKEPVCGNGVCEPGEGTGGLVCPVCDDPTKPCATVACFYKDGSCPKDCSVYPIDPRI